MAHNTNPDLRRAILDTSRQLLIEDGYKNLSMRKIAGQIGCSPGTIYLYFKNKDSIFFALIDEGVELLCSAFDTVLSTYANPMERLENLCRCYIDFGLNHPEYYEIMYMSHPLMAGRFPKEQYRRGRRILDMTAETLSACADAGLLQISDPFFDATVLWGALHGLVTLMMAKRIDIGLDSDKLIDQTIQHAINGFRRRQGLVSNL